MSHKEQWRGQTRWERRHHQLWRSTKDDTHTDSTKLLQRLLFQLEGERSLKCVAVEPTKLQTSKSQLCTIKQHYQQHV
jgi:hypothetical protein